MTKEEAVAIVRDEMSKLTVPDGIAWRAHVHQDGKGGYNLDLELWHAEAVELCYTATRYEQAHWNERVMRSGTRFIVGDLGYSIDEWRAQGLIP